MSKRPATSLREHIFEISIRKGETPAEILSVTNRDGFVRSLDVFDKQIFSQDASNYKLVRFDDLAYNPSRINVGSVARCQFREGGAVSPMYTVVRCRETLLPQFLLYFLKSNIGLQHIAHRCVGAVRFMLRFADLEQIELPIPPPADQERIVRILDEVESLLNIRARINQRRLQILPSLLDATVAGDPSFETNRVGKPLVSLVEPLRGISYGVVQRGDDVSDGVPLIRIGDFADNILDPKEIVRVAPDISARYLRTVLKGGEILVSIRGTVGRAAIVPTWAAGWNVAREVAVVPLLPGVSRQMVHAYLLSEQAQHFMLGQVRGAAQSGINLEDLRKLPIPELSAESIERFESISNDIDQIGSAQFACRTRLEDLFQSLAQNAFEGTL
jgi:type I restriction enzyme S subunit